MGKDAEQTAMPWAPPPKQPLDIAEISDQRKRTAIQHSRLDRDVHPLMGTRVVYDGSKCGNCGHVFKKGKFWKCALKLTNGPATDVRKKWPGCSLWQQPEGASL